MKPANSAVYGLNTWLATVMSLLLVIFCMPAAADQDNNMVSHPGLNKGVLLIASKTLLDSYFGQTVILLTQYDRQGTSGIILNRQSKISLDRSFPEIIKRLPILDNLFIGGPVAASRVSLLVRSDRNIDGANEVLKDIYHIDTGILFQNLEFDYLQPATTRLYSGFAGWAPGQLESEMQRGDWLTWRADASIIFSQSPEGLWYELIDLASAKWVMR